MHVFVDGVRSASVLLKHLSTSDQCDIQIVRPSPTLCFLLSLARVRIAWLVKTMPPPSPFQLTVPIQFCACGKRFTNKDGQPLGDKAISIHRMECQSYLESIRAAASRLSQRRSRNGERARKRAKIKPTSDMVRLCPAGLFKKMPNGSKGLLLLT